MKIKLALAVLAVLVLLPIPVQAVGISPGRIEVQFEPNLDTTYTFTVVNNEAKNVTLELYVSGDLAKYITAQRGSHPVNAGTVKELTFHVKLPAALEPGKHDTRIGVMGALQEGAMVGAQAGAEMQFWVYVQYPIKYIAAELTHSVPKTGETMVFNVKLYNPVNVSLLTSTDLELVELTKDGDITLERFDFGSVNLPKGGEQRYTARWTFPHDGDYKAVLRTSYDGITAKKEMGFGYSTPPQPTQETQPQPTIANVKKALESPSSLPYAAVIFILLLAIIAVIFWPEKKKEGNL